jgi:hypothetical protein
MMAQVEQKQDEGKPKFGRLLIVLILTVLLLAVITWASEAYWS